MANLNTEMTEAAITNQIRTMQYGKTLSAEANRRLTVTINKIKALLQKTPENITRLRQVRLEQQMRKQWIILRKDLRQIIKEGSKEIANTMVNRELRDTKKRLKEGTKLNKPSRSVVSKAVLAVDLAGMGTISQAVGGYVNSIERRTVSVIRQVISNNENTSSLVRQFSGNGTRSVRAAARRGLEAVSRTAATASSAAARTAFAKENEDIISGVRIVATLDDNTSEICGSLDGQVFPVGDKEPPFHVNCRSTLVFELKKSSVAPGLRASRSP